MDQINMHATFDFILELLLPPCSISKECLVAGSNFMLSFASQIMLTMYCFYNIMMTYLLVSELQSINCYIELLALNLELSQLVTSFPLGNSSVCSQV